MNQRDPLELIGYLDDSLIDEVTPCPTPKKRPLRFRYLAVAALIAALLTALTAFVFAFIKHPPTATDPLPPSESLILPEDDLLYVTIDINPSVEFTVKGQTVIAFKAYNDDGAEILKDEEYCGKHLSSVIPAFMEKLMEEGYLKPGDDLSVLLISARGSTDSAIEALLDTVVDIAEKTLSEEQIQACLLAEPILDAQKAEEMAELYGVSPGKIQYLMNIFEYDMDLVPEDAAEFALVELFRIDMKRRLYPPKYQVGEYDEYGELVLYVSIYEEPNHQYVPFEALSKEEQAELKRNYSQEDLDIMFAPRVWTTMPNVVGLPKQEAIDLLHSRNIAVRITYVHSLDHLVSGDGFKRGDCVKQEFKPGRRHNSDAIVTIWVYQ